MKLDMTIQQEKKSIKKITRVRDPLVHMPGP